MVLLFSEIAEEGFVVRCVGSFLRAECSERVVMVVEDSDGELVGYCCAAPNARAHHQLQQHHITTVRELYPKVTRK